MTRAQAHPQYKVVLRSVVPTLSSSFNNKIIELQAIKARVDQDSHM